MKQYILVADAARARILRADDAFENVEEVADLAHPTGRAKAGELVTDQNTTSTSLPTGPRSQIEPVDLQQVEARRFAHELAQRLHKDRATNAFHSLVLVAPPKFLGMLREELDAPTSRLVVGSVDRDYTHDPIDVVMEGVRKKLTVATK